MAALKDVEWESCCVVVTRDEAVEREIKQYLGSNKSVCLSGGVALNSVATGKMEYPANLLDTLSSKVPVLSVDGFAIAKEIGEIRAANVVLVGAMSAFMPVDGDLFIQVMKKRLPAKILEVNLQAFSIGREVAKKTRIKSFNLPITSTWNVNDVK